MHRHLRRFVEEVDFDHKAAAEFADDDGYKAQQVALDGFSHRNTFVNNPAW